MTRAPLAAWRRLFALGGAPAAGYAALARTPATERLLAPLGGVRFATSSALEALARPLDLSGVLGRALPPAQEVLQAGEPEALAPAGAAVRGPGTARASTRRRGDGNEIAALEPAGAHMGDVAPPMRSRRASSAAHPHASGRPGARGRPWPDVPRGAQGRTRPAPPALGGSSAAALLPADWPAALTPAARAGASAPVCLEPALPAVARALARTEAAAPAADRPRAARLPSAPDAAEPAGPGAMLARAVERVLGARMAPRPGASVSAASVSAATASAATAQGRATPRVNSSPLPAARGLARTAGRAQSAAPASAPAGDEAPSTGFRGLAARAGAAPAGVPHLPARLEPERRTASALGMDDLDARVEESLARVLEREARRQGIEPAQVRP